MPSQPTLSESAVALGCSRNHKLCYWQARRPLPDNRRVLLLIELGKRYVELRPPRYQFSPAMDHPGGCYTCRYFGERRDPAVWCANPGGEHLRSQAERGCAFWEREPGSDD